MTAVFMILPISENLSGQSEFAAIQRAEEKRRDKIPKRADITNSGFKQKEKKMNDYCHVTLTGRVETVPHFTDFSENNNDSFFTVRQIKHVKKGKIWTRNDNILTVTLSDYLTKKLKDEIEIEDAVTIFGELVFKIGSPFIKADRVIIQDKRYKDEYHDDWQDWINEIKNG